MLAKGILEDPPVVRARFGRRVMMVAKCIFGVAKELGGVVSALCFVRLEWISKALLEVR